MLHIIWGIFGAWLLGALGFNIVLTLVALAGLFYAMDIYQTKDRERHIQSVLGEWNTREINFRSRHAEKESYAESAMWLNDTLIKIFHTHNRGLSSWLEGILAPMLVYYRPAFLQSLAFSKFAVGQYPPLIQSIECSAHVGNNIQLDLDLKWCANNDIVITSEAKGYKLPAALRNLLFETKLRLQLSLIPESPYISVIHISFADRPKIDASVLLGIDYAFPFDLLDVPIFSAWLRELIEDATAGSMQWPARYTYDMLPPPQPVRQPRRVLISILEGRRLEGKNAAGDSDPYVLIKRKLDGRPIEVGRTRTILKTVEPSWIQTFELNVEDPSEEIVTLEAWASMNVKDVSIGKLTINLREELEKGSILVPQERDPDAPPDYPDPEPIRAYPPEIRPAPEWRPLKQASRGELLVGVALLLSPEKRPGTLTVNLIEACDLLKGGVLTKDSMRPYVVLKVGAEEHTSKVMDSDKPVWKASFHFNIKDADSENLLVQVFDKAMVGFDRSMGECSLAIATVDDAWIPISNGGGKGQLHMGLKFTGDDEEHVATYDRDHAAPSVTEVTEEVWENQRISPMRSWGTSTLLPTDPKPFCEADQARVLRDKDSFTLPLGWVWTSEWELSTEGGDNEGWLYAFDFCKPHLKLTYNFHGKKGFKDFVRKRRWTRTRVFRPEGDGGLAKPTMEGFVPLSREGGTTLSEGHAKYKDVSDLPTETEVVVENQRISATRTFSARSLVARTDGHPWSDERDPWKAKTTDSVVLPVGWVWSGPWRVDKTDADGEGWQYAFDFPRFGKHKWAPKQSTLKHFVRRRRWVRTRVFDPAGAGATKTARSATAQSQASAQQQQQQGEAAEQKSGPSAATVVAGAAVVGVGVGVGVAVAASSAHDSGASATDGGASSANDGGGDAQEGVAQKPTVVVGEAAGTSSQTSTPKASTPKPPEEDVEVDLTTFEGEVVMEEVFENQRISAMRNWGTSSLVPKTDAKAWSLTTDQYVSCNKDDVVVPLGWKWLGPWKIDMEDGDEEGWKYAFDFPKPGFNHSFTKARSMKHFVRRRKWVRPRGRPAAISSAAASTDDVDGAIVDTSAGKKEEVPTPPPLKTSMRGTILKRGDMGFQWKPRYCIAENGIASFYHTSEDPAPSIVFNLKGSTSTKTTKKAYSFQVVSKDGKTLHLALEDGKEMNAWISAFKAQAEE